MIACDWPASILLLLLFFNVENFQIFTKVNPNTVCFRYLNILIPIIAPDLIFVHNGTFTISGILCYTNTFSWLVYAYFGISLSSGNSSTVDPDSPSRQCPYLRNIRNSGFYLVYNLKPGISTVMGAYMVTTVFLTPLSDSGVHLSDSAIQLSNSAIQSSVNPIGAFSSHFPSNLINIPIKIDFFPFYSQLQCYRPLLPTT